MYWGFCISFKTPEQTYYEADLWDAPDVIGLQNLKSPLIFCLNTIECSLITLYVQYVWIGVYNHMQCFGKCFFEFFCLFQNFWQTKKIISVPQCFFLLVDPLIHCSWWRQFSLYLEIQGLVFCHSSIIRLKTILCFTLFWLTCSLDLVLPHSLF